VLITGCSSGVGRAAAIELAKRGHDVIATARDPSTLDDLDVSTRLRLDVTDDASVARAVAEAGMIEVLVNNAAIYTRGPIERVPMPEILRLFDVNVFGAVRLLQAVVPSMRARGRGMVVNISSVAGMVAEPLTATMQPPNTHSKPSRSHYITKLLHSASV
jgi:NAD(P)-dependent dehydrogenase (short-subunit alcohol dehydrogenase family)